MYRARVSDTRVRGFLSHLVVFFFPLPYSSLFRKKRGRAEGEREKGMSRARAFFLRHFFSSSRVLPALNLSVSVRMGVLVIFSRTYRSRIPVYSCFKLSCVLSLLRKCWLRLSSLLRPLLHALDCIRKFIEVFTNLLERYRSTTTTSLMAIHHHHQQTNRLSYRRGQRSSSISPRFHRGISRTSTLDFSQVGAVYPQMTVLLLIGA